MMFIYLLLFENFISSIIGGVVSFGLASGQTPLADSKVTLQCITNGPEKRYRIHRPANTDIAMTTCAIGSKCIPTQGDGYTFSILPNRVTIEIEIQSLKRSSDETTWACIDTNNNKKEFHLTVYNVPSSITLDAVSHTCDLGKSTCQFTCKTNGCTYPDPAFRWLYSNNKDEPTATFPNLGHIVSNSQANGCTSPAKNYQETLTLARYTVFSGNIPTTIQLRCQMQFSKLSSVSWMSDFSSNVIFAVEVSVVNITDGGINLPDGELIVNQNEQKSLTCIPGIGHPDSTVTWYIGNRVRTEGREYTLNPSNSLHGQPIYCIADNIPSNRKHDAVSSKHTLYVKVKTEYVYIEPAENNVLSVIENTSEPVICITSPGRPRSTISWLKQDIDIGEGNITYFDSLANTLEVTKSKRYFMVSRADSEWKLSCLASNFKGSEGIEANNSKSFNVLYSPENVILMFNGNPVVGSVIDVIKGTTGTLNCSASSNPPVSLFSWNINQKVGDTFPIDENIQNGQIVNCTARNIMKSTAGIMKDGYGSISKKINIQYGAYIERIEVNGSMGSTSTWEIKEEDRILIACYVDSNPDSTIRLFQGVNLLTEKEQSAVLLYNISSAQCSHTSNYTCKATNGIINEEQPASRTVQINVECLPRLSTDTEPSVFAQANTSAVLSLTILAYPIPTKYDWHRNTSNRWEQLKNSSSIRMTQASLQFNLTFTSVKPEDYGEYKLTVYYTNDVPFNFTGVLKANGEPEPHTYQPDDGSSATAGIVGGVVGGLLVVCLIVIVICFLRRRNSFDDIKSKLFGKTSAASSEEIQPQDTGYSYAAVEKPIGASSLNIISNADAETKLDGESTAASGYLYSEVNKGGRDNPMIVMQDNKASESSGATNRAKTTKAAPETTNKGPCYENPAMLIESDAKAKPQKKGKSAKQKDKKQISQSHDGLQYVELSFSDTKKKGKKTKPVQPKAEERTVYDAVQFGVVGAAYTSNGEENDTKN